MRFQIGEDGGSTMAAGAALLLLEEAGEVDDLVNRGNWRDKESAEVSEMGLSAELFWRI